MSTNNKLGTQTPARLPDDIINEIIECLPAISNFRFKCVSKQWFSLNFEALKLKSQTHTMSGIFYVTFKGASVTGAEYVNTEKDQNEDFCIDGTLSFLPKHRHVRIRDSCNGLLLCECWDTLLSPISSALLSPSNSGQTSCLYVCNPATRKWVEIPYVSTEGVLEAMLDFNPLVSVHFNVIIITCDQVTRSCKVFSSETGEWSVNQVIHSLLIQHGFYAPMVFYPPRVFYNGIIFVFDGLGSEIIGIDVKGKLCSIIESPGKSYANNDLSIFRLGQVGGCLHCYCYDRNNKMYVWKLDSGSWLLKSCFSVPFQRIDIKDIKYHPIKDDVVFLKVSDQLYSYNIKTTQTVELCSRILAHYYCVYTPFYLDFLDNGWKING